MRIEIVLTYFQSRESEANYETTRSGSPFCSPVFSLVSAEYTVGMTKATVFWASDERFSKWMLEVTAIDLVKSTSVRDIIVIGQQVTAYRGARFTVELRAMTV